MPVPNRLVIWGFAAAAITLVHLPTGMPKASAAPVITIKARSDMQLEPILRSGSRIIIRGRISDRASGDAIERVRVWVYFDSTRRTSISDENGKFEVRFPAGSGKHDLTVSFTGDARHSPVSVEIRGFDASKNPLTLTLDVPTEVPYPPKKLQAQVTAKSNATPIKLTASVVLSSVGGGPASAGIKRQLPKVSTDDKGQATFTLPAGMIGKPGRKVVELKYAGDDSYDAAQVRAEFLLVTATTLTAEVDDERISFESSAKISGRLTDNAGDGLALASISVFANGKRIGQTVTGDDGNFDVKVSGKTIGIGKKKLDVRFEPSRSWRKPSSAKPVTVSIGEPKPMPVGYTIAAFGATALALLAFVGLRAKPWQSWAWLAKLRQQEPEPEERDDDEKPPIQTGLQLAKPGLVSTLRRAADNGFSGVVRDAVTARPIAGARVEMIHTGDYAALATSAGDGSFECDGLAAGHWRATIRATGYCREQFPVGIPHRGELRGVRVDMLPVRERIFDLYRSAAQPLLPDSKKWGVWTPRQIVDHVRRSHPRPALAELTDFVEETYFSQRTPDEDILERAGGLVRAARIESGR